MTPNRLDKQIVQLIEICDNDQIFNSEIPFSSYPLGPAGSAKSLFMTEAYDRLKGWYYLDASTLSGRGFIEFLEMHQNAKVICLDEIDKLNKRDQACLYNFLESGRVLYQTKEIKWHFRMPDTKVIATSNSLEKLAKSMRSRFLTL